jgi:hypothetical protein
MATIDLGKIQPLWRGEFSPTPATNYEPLDNLSYLDTVYICILEADGSQLPINTTYFRPLIDLTTYKLQSVIAFVVSQYAGGDDTIVAPISAGLPIADYEYFVYSDFRVYAKNGATGTFSDPLDFDPDTGIDSGITGTLVNFEAITETRVIGIESDVSLLEFQSNKSITINFASDANLTLTADQNKYGRIELTDTGVILTTAREVIVDTSERNIIFINNTLQNLKIKTLSGTGVSVQPKRNANLRCDGAAILTGAGCVIEALPVGVYTSGTYIYPFGYVQTNFEQITAYATPDDSINSYGSEGVLTMEMMAESETSWSVDIRTTTGNAAVVSYVSSVSFAVSRLGNDAITQVLCIMKEGVTQ